MDKKECDRCKKIFPIEENTNLPCFKLYTADTAEGEEPKGPESIDVCKDCMKFLCLLFKAWMFYK